MYRIKQLPEDFFVREVSNLEMREKGDYAYFLMRKRSYSTQKAVEEIARAAKLKSSSIGYAGLKDKQAVTEQIISVAYGDSSLENINLKDISLKFLGRGYLKIGIGYLEGNEFRIVVRNLSFSDLIRLSNKFSDDELREDFALSERAAHILISELKPRLEGKHVFFPNYFDEQRFSRSNCEVARHFIKREFEDAVKGILAFDIPQKQLEKKWKKWGALSNMTKNHLETPMLEHLKRNPNDFVGALRAIPRRILRLYIGSFQSMIFNNVLSALVRNLLGECSEEGYSRGTFAFPKKAILESHGEQIPLMGFGSELSPDSETSKIVSGILEKEEISQREFIIREMPELSSEGSERNAFCDMENLKIEEFSNDEMNEGRYKIVFSFCLKKGSYATIAIKSLLI